VRREERIRDLVPAAMALMVIVYIAAILVLSGGPR
jgi:hypothetical protein